MQQGLADGAACIHKMVIGLAVGAGGTDAVQEAVHRVAVRVADLLDIHGQPGAGLEIAQFGDSAERQAALGGVQDLKQHAAVPVMVQVAQRAGQSGRLLEEVGHHDDETARAQPAGGFMHGGFDVALPGGATSSRARSMGRRLSNEAAGSKARVTVRSKNRRPAASPW